MTEFSATREEILHLLELALKQNESKEVLERLQWFLHFVEHHSISETCRSFGIARSTFYRWLKRFDPNDLSTLKDQEIEKAVSYKIPLAFCKAKENQKVVSKQVANNIHKCPFCRISTALKPLWKQFGLIAVILSISLNLAFIFLFLGSDSAVASSWNPTVLVNTEAFQIIDDSDTSSNIELRFGDSANEIMRWDVTNALFEFTDDVHVTGNITGSGTLTVDGAATFGSTVSINGVTYTFPTSDGTSSGKVLKTDSSGKLSWSTDDNTGSEGGDPNVDYYVKVAGDTMTGALEVQGLISGSELTITATTVHQTGALFIDQNLNGTGMLLDSEATNAPGIAIDSAAWTYAQRSNAPHLLFGYKGKFDTNLYRSTGNVLRTDDSFHVGGTLSGANLTMMAGADSYIMGDVGIGTAAPLTKLHIVIAPATEANVPNDQYDAIALEDDDFAEMNFITPSSGDWSASALNFSDDSRAVGRIAYYHRSSNAVDDSMRFSTSSIERIRIDGNGNIGIGDSTPGTKLEVAGGITGVTLEVTGAATFGDTVTIGGVAYTFPTSDGSASGKVLKTDSSGNLSWSSDAGTTYGAGQGLTIGSNTFSVNATLTGTVIDFTTVSGAVVHARDQLQSSGTLLIGGAATLGSTLDTVGNITTDADLTINEDNGGADAILTFGNDAGVETLKFNDTTNRFEFSDDIYTADTLTVDGTVTLGSTLTIGGVTYTFPSSDGSASGKVLKTDSSGNLSWSTDTDTDNDTTYEAGQGLALNGSVLTVNETLTGSSLNFTTISGATLHGQDGITSSGSLIIEETGLFHGNLDVSKEDPELRLTDTGDSNYARLTRTDASGEMLLRNIVNKQKANNRALDLDGVNEYVYMGSWTHPDAMTIVGWLKLDVAEINLPIFQACDSTTSYQNGIRIHDDGSDFWISWLTYNPYATNRIDAGSQKITTIAGDGDWHLIGASQATPTSTPNFYVDGVNIGANAPTILGTPTRPTNRSTAISKWGAYNGGYINGKFDEFAMWSSTLDDTDHTDLYNGGIGLPINTTDNFPTSDNSMGDNIVSIWHFDETSSTSVSDVTSTHDGTAYNIEDGDWITGTIPSEDVEINLIESKDSANADEEGIHTFGDGSGRTIIDGKTLRFNIEGIEKGQIDADGAFEWEGAMNVAGNLSASGTLTVEGATTLESTLTIGGIAYTFPSSDGSASGKVLKTDSAGNLSWSDDTGFSQADNDARYVNTNGDTMTGALKIQSSISGSSLRIDNNADIWGTMNISGALISKGGNTVFNEDSGDYDFRIEGNNQPSLFFVDGGADRIGIGEGDFSTYAPQMQLEIRRQAADASLAHSTYSDLNTNESGFFFRKSHQDTIGNTTTIDTERLGTIGWQGNTGTGFSTAGSIRMVQDGSIGEITPGVMLFNVSDGANIQERLRIKANGETVFNEDSYNFDFRIEGNNDENLLFADAGDSYIGIGTNSPSTKLEIAGTASGQSLHAQDTLSSSGNLVVEGTARFNNTVTLNSITYTFPAADDDNGYVLTSDGNGGLTWTAKTVNTDSQDLFKTVAIDGQDNVVADGATDTLTFAAGNNVTITTTAGSDTVTIAATDTDNDTTYEAGQGLTLTNTTFSVNSTLTGSLANFSTLSGAILHARDLLRSSGTLLVNGAATFGSTITVGGVAYTFPTSDGTASGKVLKTDGSGQLSWSADNNSGGGGDPNVDYYVRVAGDTMTGALEVQGLISGSELTIIATTTHQTGAVFIDQNLNGTGMLIDSEATNAPTLALDNAAWTYAQRSNAPHLLFGYKGTFDTNLYRSTGNVLRTDDAFHIGGTLSGASLTIMAKANSYILGDVGIGTVTPTTKLEITGTASGRSLHAQDTLSSSGNLVVEGTARFNDTVTLKDITYKFPATDNNEGYVLTSNGDGGLTWTAKTVNTDNDTTYEAGQGLTLTNTTFSVNSTLTGSLANFSTLSGAILHARDQLQSSGTLLIGGAATLGSTLDTVGNITTDANLTINEDNGGADAVLTFGNDAAAETLRFNDTTNRFEFSDDVYVSGTLTVDGSGESAIAGTLNIGSNPTSRRLGVTHATQDIIANFDSGDANAYISFTDSNTTSEGYVRSGAIGDDFSVYTGNTEKFRVTSAGSVWAKASNFLIDNNKQYQAYDVGGTVRNLIYQDSTDDLYVGSTGADSIYFQNDTGTPLSIKTTTGNIGIGTTSPIKKLDVRTGVDKTIAIGDIINNNNEYTGIHFGYVYDEDLYKKGAIFFERTDSSARGKLHFATNNNDNNLNASLADARMTIDSIGNVGIGTTTPTTKLEVIGTMSGKALSIHTNRQSATGAIYLNQDGNGTGMLIDSEASNAPGLAIDMNAGTFQASSPNAPHLLFGYKGTFDTNLYRASGATLRTDGSFGIGRTPTVYKLEVQGEAAKTAGGTSWESLSDARLKDVQGEIENAVDTINKLNPVSYKWNDIKREKFGDMDPNIQYGFLAQEIKEVIPEFVKEGPNGYLWYNPGGFEAILSAAVQELSVKINDLENRMVSPEGAGSTLTITDGVIAVTSGYHLVNMSEGKEDQVLAVINGGTIGQVLVLQPAGEQNITVRMSGRLLLEEDFTMISSKDTLILLKVGEDRWVELNRTQGNDSKLVDIFSGWEASAFDNVDE